jgi:hypothetical protein
MNCSEPDTLHFNLAVRGAPVAWADRGNVQGIPNVNGLKFYPRIPIL